MDKYQARYLKHQERKKASLEGEGLVNVSKKDLAVSFLELVEQRQSQRIFTDKKVKNDELEYIRKVITSTPSSCNRQVIQIKIVRDIKKKRLLEKLLVGGSKWASGADLILLLLADMRAYKSPAEVDFMPYLDAGFIGMNVYYASEAIGLGSCFINPNIRKENQEIFNKSFGDGYKFCGACAIGNYNKRNLKIRKRLIIFK